MLSRKQERALLALITEPTVEKAARVAKTGRSTLFAWLQEEEFRERYRELRRQAIERAIGTLQVTCDEAVEALRRNLTCGKPAIEVQAATAILDRAMRGVELLDLEERFHSLEVFMESWQYESKPDTPLS